MPLISLIAALAVAATPEPLSPAPIVAAERAFAAEGWVLGVKRSFLHYASSDAIILSPDPVNAHKDLETASDLQPGERDELAWWPLWAGIARSGDLGFTTGPTEFKGKRGGHYFTVWKRQADGSWRWIYDGGGGGDAKDEAPAGSPVGYLPLATVHASSPSEAVRQVEKAERTLARRARTDQQTAYLAVLADDGRVHAPRQPPAKDRAGFGRVLATRAAAIDFTPVRAESSAGGDLVWTLGRARWTEPGGAREGWYVRVWQDRKRGWKLIYDQIVARPAGQPVG